MKLYCKKPYYLEHYHSASEIVIVKGFVYEAKKESITKPCTISVATPDCIATYNLIKVITNDNRTITFSQEPNSQQYKYYKDYFYTESEMRRKKLIKLSNPCFYPSRIFQLFPLQPRSFLCQSWSLLHGSFNKLLKLFK